MSDLFDDVDDDQQLGPVFAATYDGDDDCCEQGIEVGESIRSDGYGGWIHERCTDMITGDKS